MTTFNPFEIQHYQRHFNLPEIGLEGQQRLKHARILCIGAGGLGSPALLYLTAAGVGSIGMVDHDVVDISNLQRQVLYSYDDVSQKKVIAARNRLQKLNPAVQIIPYDLQLTRENALRILQDYDVVIDGSDNFATRYLINDACFHLKKPYVYASINRFEGQCSVFSPEHRICFRCLFPSPPPNDLIPNCAESGVLGVLPGMMGSMQATEVLKLILRIGEPLIGRLLLFNALTMQVSELTLSTNPECVLCIHQQPFASLSFSDMRSCAMKNEISVTELAALREGNEDFILIDVREPHEHSQFNIGGELIPLQTLPNKLNELDPAKKIIVYCRSGGRSQHAQQFLQANGFANVINLTGGVMAWLQCYS